MNEQQIKEAFMQYLQQKSGAQTQQEFEAYIQQLGEEGLQQEYAQFMQMIQQQQVAARKFGGMLNYIGQLRGVCPEGYEMQFFKQGGQICKKCVQKAKMEDGGKTPQNPVDAFKCGRKMKRKAACGTKLPKDKCGSKVEMDKCGKKMKKYQNPDGPLPTAPPATSRYDGGTQLSIKRRWKFPEEVRGEVDKINAGSGGTTEMIESNTLIGNPARIGYVSPYPGDTIFFETPEHLNGVDVRTRIGRVTPSNRSIEGDILSRRIREAKSVSKPRKIR